MQTNKKEHIPAYCSIEFIEQIIQQKPIDYDRTEDISLAKSQIEIIELIRWGLDIKTDCPPNKLKEKAAKNRFIFQLMKEFRLFSFEKEFANLNERPTFFLDTIKDPTCLFLLTGFDSKLSNFMETTGNYFLCLNSDFRDLFQERIENFSRNKIISWDFAKSFIDNHSAIVIADPYLFTSTSRNYYANFIKKILPKKLNRKYHITLIGKDILSVRGKKDNSNLPDLTEISNWIQSIRYLFKNTEIDFHVYNNSEFHDRIIITNNTIIASGIGFSMFYNNCSTKDSTWIGFKPFKKVNSNNNTSVLVYKLMKDKLQTMKDWISKSEQKPTQNPLFILN